MSNQLNPHNKTVGRLERTWSLFYRGLVWFVLILCVTAFIIVPWAMQRNHGDGFADKLKIPQNIPLTDTRVPLKDWDPDEGPPPSLTNEAGKLQHPEFQMIQTGQPGRYTVTIDLPWVQSGMVYLKAYEITQNHSLSADSLRGRSRKLIMPPEPSSQTWRYESSIVIYEGDFGKPYAARFELWIEPDDHDQEILLMTKNFVIEGWQW